MVDIEADGPVPGIDMYSMIEIGAVVVEHQLNRFFHDYLKPISNNYSQEALDSINCTRQKTLEYENPEVTMINFNNWLKSLGDKLIFISDNNGFDWQFVNYYMHKFIGSNIFGFSSQNLGSLTKGLDRNLKSSRHKKLRKTLHTHNSLDDAMGNAEALLILNKEFNLGII
jgi:hypothetical protein